MLYISYVEPLTHPVEIFIIVVALGYFSWLLYMHACDFGLCRPDPSQIGFTLYDSDA